MLQHTGPDLTETTFTPEATRRVLDALGARTGLDTTGARLLRHQTNAVYQLREPVIVKITRPGTRHVAEIVTLVRWLDTRGVPTVSLLEIDQPLEIAGCAITLWHYLPQAGTPTISAPDITGPLKTLHEVGTPPVTLPALDAVAAIRTAIASSSFLTTDERTRLRTRCTELAYATANLTYTLAPGLIHGDPQHRNTLRHPDNHTPVLCDWESAVIGPREWDLVTIDVHCRRFGHPPQEYERAVQTYGFDVRDWDGYRVLRDLRELRMITTNARKSSPGSPQAREVHRRIARLHQPATDPWNIL
ncbi:aminoglycoside phosphotransferase family protein [Allokutzneria multivorans]|uniref:Aminoglycoside phosphotransferase family protein n=1 Tax=Allokutzneria multivorans TaxID=1142134 RepID=A0ABP7SD11_9PSEU